MTCQAEVAETAAHAHELDANPYGLGSACMSALTGPALTHFVR